MGSAAAGGACCLGREQCVLSMSLHLSCGGVRPSPSTPLLGLLSFEMAARRGGPGGVPATPGAARTVRSRPDASELEICCLLVSYRPLASRVFGRELWEAIASLLLGVTTVQRLPASPTTARAALPRFTRRRARQSPESSLSQAR